MAYISIIVKYTTIITITILNLGEGPNPMATIPEIGTEHIGVLIRRSSKAKKKGGCKIRRMIWQGQGPQKYEQPLINGDSGIHDPPK